MSSFRSSINLIKDLRGNRNIMVLMTTQTLFMFTAFLWWPYRSLYITELDATVELLGLVLSIETVASIIFQYPGGILTDRWGRKRMLVISGFFRFLSPIFYFFATHWTHVIPGIIFSSAGMLGVPANNALIAESLPADQRGTGFAAYRTVTSFPTIITSLMGGMIMDYFGVLPGCRYVLAASVATGGFALFMRWRYITETFTPTPASGPKRQGGILNDFKRFPQQIWVMTGVTAISMFAIRIMMSFMVIYGVEVVGLSTTQWGLIGTVVSLMTTLLTTPAGILADRQGKKPLIIVSRVLNSVSVLGYTFSHNFNQLFMVRSLAGIGNGLGGAMWGPMGGPIWQALVADLSPPEDRGRIMGLMGTVGSLVSSPASWTGGYLFDNVSPQLPFQLSFGLDMVGTVFLVMFLKTNTPEPDEDVTLE
ncbi:MAG: MFS transporter [Candidatus Bathyarchaeota archaeon]